MAAHEPLHGPDDEVPVSASLDGEVRLSRTLLAEVAGLNIHDHQAMVKAAASLDYRLRALLAALDAERGDQQ